MIRLERAVGRWPEVPPTREERERVYSGVIRDLVPADELALRRKHGRLVQERLRARQYEREAMASAHVVTEEDYQNANS